MEMLKGTLSCVHSFQGHSRNSTIHMHTFKFYQGWWEVRRDITFRFGEWGLPRESRQQLPMASQPSDSFLSHVATEQNSQLDRIKTVGARRYWELCRVVILSLTGNIKSLTVPAVRLKFSTASSSSTLICRSVTAKLGNLFNIKNLMWYIRKMHSRKCINPPGVS